MSCCDVFLSSKKCTGPPGPTGPRGPTGPAGVGSSVLSVELLSGSGTYTPSAQAVSLFVQMWGGGGQAGSPGDVCWRRERSLCSILCLRTSFPVFV